MWHRRVSVTLVALGLGAGGLAILLVPGGGPTHTAETRESAPKDTVPGQPGPPMFRVFFGGLARDELVRLTLPGLVRDRREPERVRLWIGGDSTAVYMGGSLAALTRALNGTVEGETYRTSSGLSRPDFFDWPAHLRAEMGRTSPNVVVVMFGANDPQGLVRPDGRVVSPFSEEWRAEYARRVDEALDILSAPGRVVVWVGQPVMGPEGFNSQVRAVNAIYLERTSAREDAVYVDAYALTADGAGRFREGFALQGGYISLRADDGIHFTTSGGQYLAIAVLAAFRARAEFVVD